MRANSELTGYYAPHWHKQEVRWRNRVLPAPKDNAEHQWRFHVQGLASHAQEETTQTLQSYEEKCPAYIANSHNLMYNAHTARALCRMRTLLRTSSTCCR
jgi:hypothetical protein